MSNDGASWLASLLTRTGLPAALAVALGAVSFAFGLAEPATADNRKLWLGAALVLFGVLWHAGSTWRFQHSDDSTLRSLFSVYFLAVVWWLGCFALTVWIGFGVSLMSLRSRGIDAGVPTDRFCEAWIANRLYESVDVWQARYGIHVTCRGIDAPAAPDDSQSAQAGIWVTVALTNGQDVLPASAAQTVESTLRTRLMAAVEQVGWASRYPKQVVQFLN